VSNHPPTASPTVPGNILAGKYRVERIIGQGGMGVVVVARHIALDERVALKFLLPEYATHPEASARFLREAQAAVRIKSEHVARVSDVGTLETGAPYMVMEYLEGTDLSKLLEQGVLGVQDAVDYIIQACDALAEAHSYGIVHRDLKPANLFVSKRPDGTPIVKVLDFGISKVAGDATDNLTKTTAAMGSALYMSPEQMTSTRTVDHRTDIYALGISLYELLAGKQPFYADTLPQLCAEIFTGVPTPIRSIRDDVPEGLAAVLERAYARERGFRYQSVGELVAALAPYAPIRSQVAIDSVTKMAGLQTVQAGVASTALPVPAPPGGQRGGTQMMPSSPSYPPPLVSSMPGGASATNGPVLGGFPPTTGPGISVVTSPGIPTSSSKGPMVVLAAVALLAIAGGGAYVATRSPAHAVAMGETPKPPETPAADKPVVPPASTPATVATVIPAVATATAPVAPPSAVPAAPTAVAHGTQPTPPHPGGGATQPVKAAATTKAAPATVRVPDPVGF
jgi:eukaryotic-like serine/threonine-protein kinase